jgi:hypothetical protein
MSEDIRNLVGRKLLMQISDPWEFGTEVGTRPIPVTIELVRTSQTASRTAAARTEELVIRVGKPFAYRNHRCEFFRVSLRHEGSTFATLRDGATVSATFRRTVGVDESGDANIGLIGSVCEIREDAV